MDMLLGKVTQQAMNYAIRAGIATTASFAISQSAKLLKSMPASTERDTMDTLRRRLDDKIRIIAPAIDMIELIAARGNTSLESAVTLTKELRLEIQSLGQRLANLLPAAAAAKVASSNSQIRQKHEADMRMLNDDLKKLLVRIDDSVPLINLAITTSGASLSTTLPSTVSPSRLLQASAFLTTGDTQYCEMPHRAVQIGPTFNLSVYMLFAGHNRPETEEDIRETTWKEVIHKARVKLRRVPMDALTKTGSGSAATPAKDIRYSISTPDFSDQQNVRAEVRADEFAYQLLIIEDFDDDRVHDFEDTSAAKPESFDDVQLAGIRETIPIHEISKIFYADTSKVLNIGTDAESNRPVILLKRDTNAVPPRQMVEQAQLEQEKNTSNGTSGHSMDQGNNHVQTDEEARKEDPWRLPPSLDPEWIAFEVYSEAVDVESDSEAADDTTEDESQNDLTESLASLDLKKESHTTTNLSRSQLITSPPAPWVNAMKTSLSLLELLLRLTSLQQFKQQSHLSIHDEMLNFFLEESSSTGAGGNEEYRQTLRADARRRVGFDPYNESPIKRRGEGYYEDQSAIGSPQSPGYFRKIDESREWSPSGLQTRSITAISDVDSPPSNIRSPPSRGSVGRVRAGHYQTQSSPLRPQATMKDEGIGTSPKTPST